MKRRGAAGTAVKRANKTTPRERVPLTTYAEIRGYVERLAALAETAGGDRLARVRAGAALASQALSLLQLDLERRAKEIEKLLADHPELARRLAVVTP
jgi:hypothetical protein